MAYAPKASRLWRLSHGFREFDICGMNRAEKKREKYHAGEERVATSFLHVAWSVRLTFSQLPILGLGQGWTLGKARI